MELDVSQPSVGYQLGRLFATLEKIQEESHPNINATIRKRFYGTACTTPIVAFTSLLCLKNHHYKAFELATSEQPDPKTVAAMAKLAAKIQSPIETLNLSIHSYNCLRRAGKQTLLDIADMSEQELLQVRNLGFKSAMEVIGVLEMHGLKLREI